MKIAELKKLPVTFNHHLFERESQRRLSLDKIEETIRTGRIRAHKTKFPKIYIVRYYGKENITYCAIVIKHKNFIEVKTAWIKKGK